MLIQTKFNLGQKVYFSISLSSQGKIESSKIVRIAADVRADGISYIGYVVEKYSVPMFDESALYATKKEAEAAFNKKHYTWKNDNKLV